MNWLKTIGIFLRGLFKTLNNPQRLDMKKEKLEIRKPVKEADAKWDAKRRNDKGEKKDKKRAKRSAKRAKRYR